MLIVNKYGNLILALFISIICLGGKTSYGQRSHGPRSCPDGCLCFITTVRCMHLGLDHIPAVASETRIL